MVTMLVITPVPVANEGPFMETYETWLAESSSGRGEIDRGGRRVNWEPEEIIDKEITWRREEKEC